MTVELYAVLPVSDIHAAREWYGRLLGTEPFEASPTEVVYTLDDHRYLALEEQPQHAGHGSVTVFVDDFDSRVATIAERGLEPDHRETYGNGVRKANYRDPDGNTIGLGGAP